jgi:hypothetical protein
MSLKDLGEEQRITLTTTPGGTKEYLARQILPKEPKMKGKKRLKMLQNELVALETRLSISCSDALVQFEAIKEKLAEHAHAVNFNASILKAVELELQALKEAANPAAPEEDSKEASDG